MNSRTLTELSDQELLEEAKKVRTATLINALLIGFLIGIIVYSIFKNTLGLFTLIPLFLIYRLANSKTKYDKQELKNLLKERNLK